MTKAAAKPKNEKAAALKRLDAMKTVKGASKTIARAHKPAFRELAD